MKSYKEINDEIEVSLEVKEKTLQKLNQKKTTSSYRRIRYAGACILLFAICGTFLLLNGRDKTVGEVSDQMKANESIKQSFHLDDYIVADGKTGGSNNEYSTMDIAGSIEEMSETLRDEVSFAPKKSDLVLPEKYETRVNFGQYVYENIGPFAYITYHSEAENKYQFDFTIQDMRMPRCMPFGDVQQRGLKPYNEYHIEIIHNSDTFGNLCYRMYGYRDGYYVEGSAIVEKEEDFTNFLVSFLR